MIKKLINLIRLKLGKYKHIQINGWDYYNI